MLHPRLVLDGGSTQVLDFLTEDEVREVESSPLWTNRAVTLNPTACTEFHRAHAEAGADIIQTLTYQLSPTLVGEIEYRDSARAAAQAALRAIALSEKDLSVCYSFGPYAASRLDGSEYTARYSVEELARVESHHARQIKIASQMAEWADIRYVAFETLPDVQEASLILKLLQACDRVFAGKRVWLSFSCATEQDISRVCAAVQLTKASAGSQLWGLGVNCFKPALSARLASRLLLPGSLELDDGVQVALVVYQDGGRTWDSQARAWSGPPLDVGSWTAALKPWLECDGTLVLGGCCQTTAKHIESISRALRVG